jgi:hypothetical protein
VTLVGVAKLAKAMRSIRTGVPAMLMLLLVSKVLGGAA